jgi:hypothetical protein
MNPPLPYTEHTLGSDSRNPQANFRNGMHVHPGTMHSETTTATSHSMRTEMQYKHMKNLSMQKPSTVHGSVHQSIGTHLFNSQVDQRDANNYMP